MVAIGQDFGLNNWHNTVSLANGCITGQHIGILQNCLIAGGVLADLQNGTPLGEVATVLLVLSATGIQIVKTLGGAFTFRSEQINDTGVDLDARNDSLLLQDVNEWGAILVLLVQGFVEQNHTGDVFGQFVVGGEEKLTVGATVLLGVFGTNVLKIAK